jgi:regulation of enolase protein 1 (concanavalin A-like superfamily)
MAGDIVLTFDGSAGGLSDSGGVGTGFTRTQLNQSTSADFDASLLEVKDGLLTIESIAGNDGTNSRANNNLVNALQLGYDGTTSHTIETRIVGGDANSLGAFDARYEQAGLLLGGDADAWVKLVAIHHDDGPRIQFTDEWPDGSGGTASTAGDGLTAVSAWSTVTSLDLRLTTDPAGGTVTAMYRVNDGAWMTVPNTITIPANQRATFFQSDASAGVVVFHRNTDGGRGLKASFESFSVRQIAPAAAAQPSVASVRPGAGATNVSRDTFIAVDVSLPAGAIDPSTVSGTSVYLVDNSTSQIVPGAATVSGGGDAITFTPTSLLAATRSYTFHITSDVQDVNGTGFAAFSTTFTTGTAVADSLPSVAFNQSPQSITQGIPWTAVEFGPDGNLYAATADGEIHRFAINSNGSLTNRELLVELTESDGMTPRLITGFAFDTSESELTVYVSHGAYIDPGDDQDRTAREWSGKITRVSGDDLETVQDVVVGLPRSVYDHLNNQPVFGPDGRLYFVVPSNTAMGAPDSTWGNRPERLLSAAVVALDLDLLTGTLDVQTEDRGANNYDPYAAGAPLTIFATGVRNAYDLVFTADGHLYAPANGSAAGGNAPASPDNSIPAINGVNQTQHDLLYRIVEGGYYGHPNPVRGEYVLGGGNPTNQPDPAEVSQYPVGTQPDANWQGFAHDFGLNISPNGVIQYSSDGTPFGGALDGKLVVVRFSGGDDLMFLENDSATGDITQSFAGSFGAGGMVDPLDLTLDPTTGNLYVVEAGFRSGSGTLQITLLTPVDAAELTVTSDARDFGNGDTLHLAGETGTDDTTTLTLANSDTGTVAFPSDAVQITGPDADAFRIVSGDPAGTSLAAGESSSLIIAFNGDALRVFEATLTIRSNGPNQPDQIIRLRGLGTAGEGGNLEPSLQRILDLYELPINVADPDDSTVDYPQQTNVVGSDEVALQLLEKAGSGSITLELLGSFGTSASNGFTDTSGFGWYSEGSSSSVNDLFTIDKSDAQTVHPSVSGDVSFDTSDSFGLVATFFDFGPRDVYTQDALNTWESEQDERRKIRFFPLKDAAGNVVPNAYVFAIEEWDVATDQNDIVGIIRNVQPAIGGEARTENLSLAPTDDFLAFNKIRDLDPVVPNETRLENTLRLHNDGSGVMTITGASIDSSDFEIVGGFTPGLTLSPGGFHDFTVRFTFDGDGSKRVEVRRSTLTIQTDSPDTPTVEVGLGGIWQRASEQIGYDVSQEANLAEMIRGLGFDIDVGPDTGLSDYDTGTNTGGAIEAVGEEIISPYFQKAGSGSVEVVQLAAFHQQRDPNWDGTGSPAYFPNTTFLWHRASDGIGSASYNKLFKHKLEEGQSVLPLDENGNGPAAATFDPGSDAFGFAIDWTWHSDPQRNRDLTPDNAIDESGFHAMRWFAVYDHNGNLVPNTYLIAQDNVGNGGNLHNGGDYAGSNFDYQDNLYLVRNVRPVSGPSEVVDVTAGGSASGISVTWTASSEGNVGSYVVQRATGSGSFSELGTVTDGTSYLDTSADQGTAYRYRVLAVDYHGLRGDASSDVSASRPVTGTAPAAPTGVAAVAASFNQVNLTWNDVSSDETGFRVERSSGSGFTTIVTLGSGTTNYSDTNVDGATSYTYRVVAFNANGDSPAASDSVTTPEDLSAAVAVSANATAYDTVAITWADASDNEAGFRIERSTGGSFSIVGNVGAGSTSFTDTGLVAEETYTYRVVTVGSSMDGGISATTSVTTPADPSDVAAPTDLVATSFSWSRVDLQWTHDGTRATGFEIRRGGYLVATVASSVRTWADLNVDPETSYAYDVRAINLTIDAAYSSPASNTLNITTPRDASDLAAPGNFTAEAVTRSQINLTWDGVTDASFFVLERRVGTGAWQSLATSIPSTQTSYVDSTASAATTYEYRVRARNAFNVTDAPFSTTTVTTMAADALLGSLIGSATGTLTGDNAAFTLTATGTSDQTDLGDDDDLHFANRSFVGDFDLVLRIDSVDAASPATATGIMVRDNLADTSPNVFLRFSGDTVAMSWRTGQGGETRSPTGATSAPDSPYLRLVRNGNTFTGYVSANGTTWTTVATSDPITMASTARVGSAVASYSTDVSTAQFSGFGTYQAQPPAAPTSLVATAGNDVVLTWVDASANELGFRVERQVVGDSTFTQIADLDAGTTAYTDTTAVAGVNYVYRITSYNDAGNASSDTASATIAIVVPPPPGDATVPPIATESTGGAALTWPSSTGDVTSYVVERRLPGGDWEQVARVGTNALSLNDATAPAGTTIEYRVRADSNGVLSGPSMVTTVTRNAAADTSPPRLDAKRVDGEVHLTWDGNSTILLQRRVDGGDWTDVARHDGTSQVDAAPFGSAVEYRIRYEAGASDMWRTITLQDAVDERIVGTIGNADATIDVVSDFRHFDVSVTGGDGWGFEDEVAFAGHSVRGDFDVAVRITGGGSGDWMAGLMVRSSDNASASNVFLKRREGDLRLTTRFTDFGQSAVVATQASATQWVRLIRRGDAVIALGSDNGTTWTEFGRVQASLGRDVRVGIAAAGGEGGSADLRFRDYHTVMPARAPEGLKATGSLLSWNRVDHAAGYTLQRRIDGGMWQTVATTNALAFNDLEQVDGTRYQYRVSATGGEFSEGIYTNA